MGHNQDVISWVKKARTGKTISIKTYINFVSTISGRGKHCQEDNLAKQYFENVLYC